MTIKKLRFEEGNPVEIELIEAKDTSLCRFGYKVGDSWIVNAWENSGLRGMAYSSFFPWIILYQTKGAAGYGSLRRKMC